MDWATTVGIGTLILATSVTTLLLVRWGIGLGDDRNAAIKSQLEQLANQHEAERQRDAAVIERAKADGDLALALRDVVKLHAAIDALITTNQAAIKEKVNAATGDDLIAAARAVFGVPQLSNVPGSSGAGGAAAAGGDPPAAAVPVPARPGAA